MNKSLVLSGHEVAFGYGDFLRLAKFEDEKSNVTLSVGYFPSLKAIAVRCYPTKGVQGWITNFLFSLKPWKVPPFARKGSKVKYHSGYLNAWMRLRDEVTQFIKILIERKKDLGYEKLIVSGASQGGALSPMVALDLAYNLHIPYCNVFVTDFFGPKAYNKYAKESIEKRIDLIHKIRFGNDIVSKIPPFYHSVGLDIHIGPLETPYTFSPIDHYRAFDKKEVRKLLDNI